jgi:hypothetical protein
MVDTANTQMFLPSLRLAGCRLLVWVCSCRQLRVLFCQAAVDVLPGNRGYQQQWVAYHCTPGGVA